MNNKGQVLIAFILLLPILLFTFLVAYDIGNIIVEKNKLNNINYLLIDYGINNINKYDVKEKIIVLQEKNDNKIDIININIENNEIRIDLSKNVKGLFSSLINIKEFKINSSYLGKLESNKKKIERVG